MRVEVEFQRLGWVQLELDENLVALGVSFDNPEFFDKALVELRAGGTAANRARRLLPSLRAEEWQC